METSSQVGREDLDQEWESLFKKAKEMGISIQEIRIFIHQKASTDNKSYGIQPSKNRVQDIK